MAHSHILVGAGASVANPLSGNLQLTRWRSLWLSYISMGQATAWMSQSLRIRFACGGSALLRIALGPLDQFESGTRELRALYMVFQQTTVQVLSNGLRIGLFVQSPGMRSMELKCWHPVTLA